MKPIIYIIIFFFFFFIGCQKYLEKKPDQSLVIPKTFEDYNSLLEANNVFQSVYPYLPDQGCDDYYLDSSYFLTLSPTNRASYIWERDIYKGLNISDWSRVYSTIYIANIVLDGINRINITNSGDLEQKNNLIGRALFIRSFGHFTIEEGWGQPYNPTSSSKDLGIPLKLTTNLSEKSTRASVKEVFDQILSDLKLSASLLPTTTQNANYPTKATAYGMLARVCLTMHDFVQAGKYADSSLQINNTLVDYNTLSASSNSPFIANSRVFSEALYASSLASSPITLTNQRIDTFLFNSYTSNDLRKLLFFRLNTTNNTYSFKGIYANNFANGPAIDEMYLVRAECYARYGNTASAMKDLNDLLKTRWRKNTNGTTTYVNQTAISSNEALIKILTERRKELCFRGLRWMDLRRLNQEPQFAITIKRIVSGVTYTLAPNDPKYALPIPPDEIQLSGLVQNPR
ncbi:MAG: RagB/SusD family nutrient uptake outer membrane protein [Sediminibacterium sp.]|nr:RagB/SusD family nutrient uptake outer membrane protein [Sediminibacterium sp.]